MSRGSIRFKPEQLIFNERENEVSDPPMQGEMQAVVDKLDELILALRRLA